MPNEYNRTSSVLRKILQQNFSSGIYNMVGGHNFTIILWSSSFSGEIRTMIDQEAQTRGYLDTFFKQRPNIGISWIHDIGTANYVSAASALLHEAETAVNLEEKHVRSS